MKYFDTFTGIGGFTLAIENINEIYNLRPNELANSQRPEELHNTPNEQLKWECVGYSEIDKYASSIYQKHYPEHKNYGDITKINAEELPDFDLLVGGFPCQAFSIAGKRGGFEDTRGTLFFDLARILQTKKPRLFVFENVKGLLSHDKGNTFKTIIATIDELGYDCQWQVLNSKNFGVPQNRERVFIVGHLRGTSRPEVFPITSSDGKNNESDRERSSLHTQTVTGQGGLNARGSFVETAYALDSSYYKGTNTIEKSRRQLIREQAKIRRLTPKECERLQGFPDNWTEGVSDTQRYKCCGNAVTVNVVAHIMKYIV